MDSLKMEGIVKWRGLNCRERCTLVYCWCTVYDSVQEEGHEWGSQSTAALLSSMSSQATRLAKAANYWRLRLRKEQKVRHKEIKKSYQVL